jgi:homoserine kinase
VIASKSGDEFHVSQIPFGPDLGIVLFIPDMTMSTDEARKVLPAMVPRTDAVFNSARTALLTLALVTEQYDLLPLAMEDRMHQPYRQQIYPQMRPLFNAALEAGAFGAFLSGSGSSIAAFAVGNEQAIEQAFAATSARLGFPGRTLVTRPSAQGAQVEFTPGAVD